MLALLQGFKAELNVLTLLCLLPACTAVETHIATSPAPYTWAEPAGKVSYPLVLSFDGGELLQPLAGVGYGVVVVAPLDKDAALQVLTALRDKLPRWDGQLLIIGVSKGAPSAVQLAKSRAVAGLALLLNAGDPEISDPRLGNVFQRLYDGSARNDLFQWLCQSARASGCPARPAQRYVPDGDKQPGEDLRLNAH